MSRLYGRLQSDRRKTDATVGANESLTCRLTHGSAHNPKMAMDVLLTWHKGLACPSLVIDISDNIRVRMFRSGRQVYGRDPK